MNIEQPVNESIIEQPVNEIVSKTNSHIVVKFGLAMPFLTSSGTESFSAGSIKKFRFTDQSGGGTSFSRTIHNEPNNNMLLLLHDPAVIAEFQAWVIEHGLY